MAGLLESAFTAPYRAMEAQAPQAPQSMGLIGRIHNAIDPVQAMGGYGGLLAMALPPGKPVKMDMPLFHGSPTLKSGPAFEAGRSAAAPRTDPGYLGRAMYFTPQEWIAKHYAKPAKGGVGAGNVVRGRAKEGKFLDVTYDENYIQNLNNTAEKLGIKERFGDPGWSDAFGNAARKEGYDGARGLNLDGTVAEVAIFDPRKMMDFD
jgi:hypothetical protein